MARLGNPKPQFFEVINGEAVPLSDGTITFYETGTSTLASIYTDDGLTTPATNPQPLDADGRTEQNVFLTQSEYRVVLKNSSGATVWDIGDYSVADVSGVEALVEQIEALIDSVTADLFSPNYIVNGEMQLDPSDTESTPLSLTTAYQETVTDIYASVLNNVSAGTVGRAVSPQLGESGYCLAMAGVTHSAAGTPAIRYQMPSKDAYNMSGKTLTISLVVRHDTGAPVSYAIQTYVADAADNFAAVTATGISSTTSVESGQNTTISVTGAFGTLDNGFEIRVIATPGVSVTTKNYYWSDFQLSISGVVLPFRPRLEVYNQLLATEGTILTEWDQTLYTQTTNSGAVLWTKADYTAGDDDTVYVEGWGGGASGSVFYDGGTGAGRATGGSGGGYIAYSLRFADAPATITGSVGAAGASVNRASSGATDGNAGGNTSVTIGSLTLVAVGGVAGDATTGTGTNSGSAGGGQTIAGIDPGMTIYDGGASGDATVGVGSKTIAASVGSVFGGGGGASATGGDSSERGNGTAGTSVHGGAGGASASGTGDQTAAAGTAPGGGGGAATGNGGGNTVTSGAGGAGRVKIRVIKGRNPAILGVQ